MTHAKIRETKIESNFTSTSIIRMTQVQRVFHTCSFATTLATRDEIQDASIRHELSTTVYVASRLQETVTCPLNPHPLTCRRLRMPRTRTRTGRVARDVRGFLADPSWFRGAGYARWIPDHPNWMPVTGLIRAASVWSRFDWIGRGGWRARLEILTLSSPSPFPPLAPPSLL